MNIPFIKPYLTGKELHNIATACLGSTLGEGGYFSNHCEYKLREIFTNSEAAVLTSSIGSSFELAADLLEIKPGDEVIIPSFTSVASANAFVRRGAVICFADIQRRGLNLSRDDVSSLINERTRAIVVPHYAGIPSDITEIASVVASAGIILIEDITQAFLSTRKGRLLGSFGDFSCISFYETEGIHAGEGGALILNNKEFVDTAEILKFRGTKKMAFAKGKAEYYGWEQIGGEYCANEVTSAFLFAQLEAAFEIKTNMKQIWKNYLDICHEFDTNNILERPSLSNEEQGSGNFYLILPEKIDRIELISGLYRVGIECRGHYYPLHQTTAGMRYGKNDCHLPITENLHGRIIRLPSFIGISKEEQVRVIKILLRLVENKL